MSRKGSMGAGLLGVLLIAMGATNVLGAPAPSAAIRISTSSLNTSCVKDEECTIVETDCGGCSCDAQIAINKNSLQKYGEARTAACQHYTGGICDQSCSGGEPGNVRIVARCVQNRCVRGTQWGSVYDQVPFRAIHEVNDVKLASGTYRTSGYVVSIYQCPDARGSVPLETCLNSHIVVSEKSVKAPSAGSAIENDEMILLATSPRSRFQMGSYYDVTFFIPAPYKSTGKYAESYFNGFKLGASNGPRAPTIPSSPPSPSQTK